jgi:aminomethyltransferase
MNPSAPAHQVADEAQRTPLYDLHVDAGGRMTPFAGYSMPVQFSGGIIAEHVHTREHASLFDVSHMGQAWLRGTPDVAALMERLVPGELQALKPGRMRYTQLLNDDAGIIDDLMITKFAGTDGAEVLFLVVNGACKHGDFAHIAGQLGGEAELEILPHRALIALQGPRAVDALSAVLPQVAEMPFMSAREVTADGLDMMVSRCGYTGEDGFEISLDASAAAAFARRLLALDGVAPAGLGARDSLRLEAGLCLYGNDIDTTTSPIEANLTWSIGKRRREEGGFAGDARVLDELAGGAKRRLVGIAPQGRAPARQGAAIHVPGGAQIGTVTSGSFGPSYGGPVAMGYVAADHAEPGGEVDLMVRGKALPAKITGLPFVPHRYYRGSKS